MSILFFFLVQCNKHQEQAYVDSCNSIKLGNQTMGYYQMVKIAIILRYVRSAQFYASSLQNHWKYHWHTIFLKISFRYTMLVYSICLYAIRMFYIIGWTDRYVCVAYGNGMFTILIATWIHMQAEYLCDHAVNAIAFNSFSYKYDRCAIEKSKSPERRKNCTRNCYW